jgi:hypothetical protein
LENKLFKSYKKKNPYGKLLRIAEQKKNNGEYDTYRDAYKASIRNIKSDNRIITVKSLEAAYYKTKTKKKALNKTVSIPIMITQEMRIRLKGLKYSSYDIRYLTPQKANDIIRNQVVNRSPSLNHGRNQ